MFWHQPLMKMEPSDEHTWTVTVDDNKEVAPVQGTEGATVSGIGGGKYVFETDGWFEDKSHEEKTGFCARFTVEGDEFVLTPTDDAVAEHDGERVIVTDDREETEGARLAAFVVERVAETEDAERIIPEQAVRGAGFSNGDVYRNTLPFFEEDVEVVRYETYDTTHPVFGIREPRVIEYEGGFYGVSAEELER
jgi:hypothetical protein